MAVIAPELSRDSIWRAIRNKRVYGTSGPRIKLRFTINSNPMGSSITIEPDGSVSITARAEADGDGAVIEKYEIIKNGAVLYSGTSNVNYTDTGLAGNNHYYIRVTQRNEDGCEDRSWSSPIWVSVTGS